MTVARYLERQGLMEECITWLQHHYPKVKYFRPLFHIFSNLNIIYPEQIVILSPGGPNALWEDPSSIPPSQAGQDKDEVSGVFINLCNQNFKENHKITIFSISNQRWDQLILDSIIYICAKKIRCN